MAKGFLSRNGWRLLTTVLVLNAAGCVNSTNPDPYESYNRKIFKFNQGVDKVVFRPIALGYDKILPNPVKKSVGHFFGNLDEIPSAGNDLLQFKGYYFFADSTRFIVNSTFGIGGLFDVASHIDLPEHHNDFGLTLAVWGMKQSPYFLVPFWGPTTVRDLFGLPPNIYMGVWAYVNPAWVTYAAWGVQFTDRRAALLPTDKLVRDAYDPYAFVRDAYLQSRNAEINGNNTAQLSGTSSDTTDTFVPAGNEATSTTSAEEVRTKVPSYSTKPTIELPTLIPESKKNAAKKPAS